MRKKDEEAVDEAKVALRNTCSLLQLAGTTPHQLMAACLEMAYEVANGGKGSADPCIDHAVCSTEVELCYIRTHHGARR